VRFLDSDGDEVDYDGNEFEYHWEVVGNCGSVSRLTGSRVVFRADPGVLGDCYVTVRALYDGNPVSAEETPPGKSDVKVWGLVVESPGGMAVDRAGNIYVSDQGHGGEKEGSVVIFARNGQTIRFIQDLTLPGDIEVSQDGKALIISESGGKIERIFFGLSGQIKDPEGNLLVGAAVTVEQGALTYPGTAGKEHQLKTNSSGRFHVMDMHRPLPTKDPPELDVIVTVEFQGNTQEFEASLEPEGHTIREFVFNP